MSGSKGGPGAAARVRTERDLQTELTRLAVVLQDKDNWERRLEALQQMREILEMDHSRGEAYLPLVTNIVKIPLQLQVVDLRSSIVKEACGCVRAMAQAAAPGAAEAVSDWYIKDLLNASCATVAVIAQSADDTLKIIAASGRVNRPGLQAFFAGCQSKHSVIRRNAYNYLLTLLTSVDPATLQRHVAVIDKLLRSGVTDALQDARKVSRLAVWAFERVCPKQAHELVNGLESAVKRAVEADQIAFEQWLESGEVPGMSPTKRGSFASTVNDGTLRSKAGSSAALLEQAGEQRGSSAPSRGNSAVDLKRTQQDPPPNTRVAAERPVPAAAPVTSPTLAPGSYAAQQQQRATGAAQPRGRSRSASAAPPEAAAATPPPTRGAPSQPATPVATAARVPARAAQSAPGQTAQQQQQHSNSSSSSSNSHAGSRRPVSSALHRGTAQDF
jgi:hypothetical protein